jgi:hypothetical protein
VKARQTSGEWSERVGGHQFAQALAQDKKISLRKAEKILRRTGGEGYEDVFLDLADIFEATIAQALSDASKVKPVDEVQLLGGGSALRFIVDSVKKVTNRTVRKDFNANEAIAMGAAAHLLIQDGGTPYVEVQFTALPPVSYNATCGNTSQVYCTRNGNCKHSLNVNNEPEICSVVGIVPDQAHLAPGVVGGPFLYEMTNQIVLTGQSHLIGEILFEPPEAVVKEARWCIGDRCDGSEFAFKRANPEEWEASKTFLDAYVRAHGNKAARAGIAELLAKLDHWISKVDTGNVEAPYPITDEMRAIVGEVNQTASDGGLDRLDSAELAGLRAKLDEVAKGLHVTA